MNTILRTALLAAVVAAVPVMAAAAGEAKFTVQQSDEFGAYIADADGRALYMFTADTQGQEEQNAASNCYDACADAWPPLLSEEAMAEDEPMMEEKPQAGKKINKQLVGTIERTDGTTQLTYNGWPLYYYVRDTGPGEVTGQDVQGFGGEWYLVAPDGTKIDNEKQ